MTRVSIHTSRNIVAYRRRAVFVARSRCRHAGLVRCAVLGTECAVVNGFEQLRNQICAAEDVTTAELRYFRLQMQLYSDWRKGNASRMCSPKNSA